MTLPTTPSYHPDYARLTACLTAREEQRITVTFAHLEQEILLGMLPLGARRQGSWWSNTATNRGLQNQSMVPSVETSAVVCRSPISPWSAIEGYSCMVMILSWHTSPNGE